MNSAEHYAEAERLLERARGRSEVGGRLDGESERYLVDLVEAAQVHASLALAGATAGRVGLVAPSVHADLAWEAERRLWIRVLYGDDVPADETPGGAS